jgi:hypothetical protein
MHPVLEAVKKEFAYRREAREGVPSKYTPPSLRHKKLVTLRMFDRVTKDGKRYDLIVKLCPACKCGFIDDLSADNDKSIPAIPETQYRAEVRAYVTKCNEGVLHENPTEE